MLILIVGIVILLVVAGIVVLMGKKSEPIKTGSIGGGKRNKTQAQIIREANKKLEKNPQDAEGLMQLADVYFANKLWDKALPLYDQLFRLATKDPLVDGFKSVLRHGICAVNLDQTQEALASLNSAYKLEPRNYDVNLNLGIAMYKEKQYDKAIPCLKKALILNPDAEGVYFILGKSYYEGHHYRDSLPCFKRALGEDPSNKEALFCMADATNMEGHGDQAIKVFMHLRPDPVYGPRSCLEAGVYHMKTGDFDGAVQDFAIGMKHNDVPQDVMLDLEYRTAQCFFSKNDFAMGLQYLNKIRTVNANYRDVNALASRYQELSQNKNLQVYLSAGASDFVALCRKFIETVYRGSQVKVMDISVQPAYTDITVEVDSPRLTDTEIFRFFRTSASTGELYVRDFHGHMHDVMADRGFCITAGIFTEEAHKYIEGRPLDLVEKAKLTKVLKAVSI